MTQDSMNHEITLDDLEVGLKKCTDFTVGCSKCPYSKIKTGYATGCTLQMKRDALHAIQIMRFMLDRMDAIIELLRPKDYPRIIREIEEECLQKLREQENAKGK